ncbi:hypothetical protein VM1G_05293 [Cytospora mali]|uniref:Uncharacterized protein n=1 Tax=Cytospora mali TaxID=578113 RepID=A0A194W1Q7_CYTMA|nr:hypothetical protein VM1G_05293 [Valsa mali]
MSEYFVDQPVISSLGASSPPNDPSEAFSRYIKTPLHWPTPLHDTMAGYDWIIKTFSPERLRRRPVYVYGSYLGASLASSLALTESHTHQPMAVRGLMAFNGIYNWSRMLPGHPANKIAEDDDDADASGPKAMARGDQDVAPLADLVPSLFKRPSDLFDPFASPVLFFHTAGMLAPSSFGARASYRGLAGGADPHDLPYVYSDPEDPSPPSPYDESDGYTGTGDTDTDSDAEFLALGKWPPPQRKGYFAFPAPTSSLKIPETLLLHTTSTSYLPGVTSAATSQRRERSRPKKLKSAENSFEAHALGLAKMMRKSINRLELREMMKWEPDLTGWVGEAMRRVGVEDVGPAICDGEKRRAGESGLSDKGEEAALRWLEERIG